MCFEVLPVPQEEWETGLKCSANEKSSRDCVVLVKFLPMHLVNKKTS